MAGYLAQDNVAFLDARAGVSDEAEHKGNEQPEQAPPLHTRSVWPPPSTTHGVPSAASVSAEHWPSEA